MNINLREASHLYWKLRDWQRATELADESRSDDDYAFEEEAWTALEEAFRSLGYSDLPEATDALRAAGFKLQWR